MFGRIKEAVRILSYSEEVTHPDFRDKREYYVEVSRSSVRIGKMLAGVIAIAIGSVTYQMADKVVFPGHPVLSSKSASQIITATFLLIAFVCLERMKNKFASRLNLHFHLAPYFGHKVENARRILKAKTI